MLQNVKVKNFYNQFLSKKLDVGYYLNYNIYERQKTGDKKQYGN